MHGSNYYVYIIRRTDGTPCYVGKGRGRRYLDHARKTHNSWLRRIYSKAGGVLPVTKTADVLTASEAAELERLIICDIGRADLGLGPLVNFTDGGDGTSGIKRSKESIDKVVAALRGRRRPNHVIEAIRIASTGRPMPPHVREILLKANTGRKRTPETGRRISVSLAGKPRSESTKEKISASLTGVCRGIPKSPEHRAAIGLAHKGRKPTPEAIAKSAASRKGQKRSPEAIAKAAISNTGKKRSEEVKARQRAARLAFLERQRTERAAVIGASS